MIDSRGSRYWTDHSLLYSSVSLRVVYQYFLTYGGLEDYIQNAPRVDIISMNKEGIFSFAGKSPTLTNVGSLRDT